MNNVFNNSIIKKIKNKMYLGVSKDEILCMDFGKNKIILEFNEFNLLVITLNNYKDDLFSFSYNEIINNLKDVYQNEFVEAIEVNDVTNYYKKYINKEYFSMNKYYKDCITYAFYYILYRYIYSYIDFKNERLDNDEYLELLSLKLICEDYSLINYFKERRKSEFKIQ